MKDSVLQLYHRLLTCKKAVFFGGAGVSTESGIPDFRSESGIYRTVQEYGVSPEEILSHTFFVKHPDIFYQYYRKYMLYPSAVPNAAHRGLAFLERQGVLTAVLTQNIDGLHQRAGRCWNCAVPSIATTVWTAAKPLGLTPFYRAKPSPAVCGAAD